LQRAPLNAVEGALVVRSGYNHCGFPTRCVDRSSVCERARYVETRSRSPTVGHRIVEVGVIEYFCIESAYHVELATHDRASRIDGSQRRVGASSPAIGGYVIDEELVVRVPGLRAGRAVGAVDLVVDGATSHVELRLR
jgi:hypothetical protein